MARLRASGPRLNKDLIISPGEATKFRDFSILRCKPMFLSISFIKEALRIAAVTKLSGSLCASKVTISSA